MRKKLLAILNRGEGERELQVFLEENPVLLLESLSFLGRPVIVIKQFPLGIRYKADFLVISLYSGAFELKLIELEPPLAKIFNQDGSLAKRANKALEQVNSWAQYIKRHYHETLETVEKYGKEKDLYRGPRESFTCTADLSIFHPSVHVSFEYAIMMGRREELSPADLGRKSAFKENNKVEIISCDRLLTGADKIDANPEIYI